MTSSSPQTATNAPTGSLKLDDASLDFGGAGVFNLNIDLPQGTILGLIGPSGCGKTTTIRLLNGVYGPTGGAVRVFGKDPQRFSMADKARIGYIPQHFILYPTLTVEENLHFLGRIYGMTGRERAARIGPILKFVELQDARRRLASRISGGMQRRLMLAGALLHEPDLLMADEPTAGIDPILRARIWDNFRTLRDQGKTLLVSTQYVGEAAYCDQVAIMRRGRLVAVDTPKGLQCKAMGGEAVHVQVEPGEFAACRRALDDSPRVSKVERIQGEPGGMYAFVEDAARELPAVLELLRDAVGVTPRVAEPYQPSFDEVFVRLIHAADAAQLQEAPAS